MDPILRVIHYLFKQKNKDNVYSMEEDLQSFFENGINFPKFVALSFNIEEIPKVNPTPKTPFHKKINNELAYKYLKQNNQEINRIDPNYTTHQDQVILLSLILTKQCFKLNYNDTLSRCNQIVKPLGISFKNKKDILNVESLFSLINVLTNVKVPTRTKSSNLNDLMIQVFKKANVPLIIDDTSLQMQNQFLFFIQIEILFDIFSDKIKELTKCSEIQPNENKDQLEAKFDQKNLIDSKSSDDDDEFRYTIENEEEEENIFNDEKDVVNSNFISSNAQNEQILQANNAKETKQKKKIDYSYSSLYSQDIILNPLILDTINAIGKNCNLHFKNFEEAVKKENPTRIVMHILQNDESSQKVLQNIINSSKENQIELVIEFLKTKDAKFKVLLFDFEDPNYIESSSISFYTNLLDFFYLKKSKQEIYDRCYTLLFGKYKKSDDNYVSYDDEYKILCNFSTYEKLINFVNHRKCKFQKPIGDDLLQNKIPFVISEQILQEIAPNYIPNVLYYQLQLIFDVLDNSDSNHRVVELLLEVNRKFSMVKIPNAFELVQSIRAKNISRILQKTRYEKIISEKRKDENVSIKNSTCIPQIESTPSQRAKIKSSNNEISDQKLAMELECDYDLSNKNFFYENGILKDDIEDEKLWDDLKKYLIKKMKMKAVPYFLTDNGTYKGTKYPVYKLFVYDENINDWVFNNDEFSFLEQDSKYFYNVESIPLVSFIETNSYQSFQILKNIYSNQLDNFELKSEQICVFGVCSKFLDELRFDKKLLHNDKQSSKIKPLFLFLYAPENKKNLPSIPSIVFQIYIFLSFISDISIVVFRGDQFSYQSKFMRIIDSLYADCIEFFSSSISRQSISNEEENKNSDYEEENNELNILESKKQQLNEIDYSIIKCDNNLLLVFDDDDFSNYNAKKKLNESNLMKDIIIFNFVYKNYLSFMNSKDPSTYAGFINNFCKCAIQSENNRSTILSKFKHIQFFKINNVYVELKFEDKHSILQTKNNKIINDKLNKLISNDKQVNYASQLQQLQKELYDEFPIFDASFFFLLNESFNLKKKQLYVNKNEHIKRELELRSATYINYLLELIDSKPFWSKDQLDNLKFSHFDFLKEEFLEMINDISHPDQIASIYTECKSILDDQIDKDKVVIGELFKGIEDQFKQKIPREVDPQKGANFTIRERETEREVKVRTQKGGKLEDLLQQDF